MAQFFEGELFSSIEELEKKIEVYKQEHYTELKKGDAHTIANALKNQKITKDTPINHKLRYYDIKYQCIHSGKFKPRGDGKRQTRQSFYIFFFSENFTRTRLRTVSK